MTTLDITAITLIIRDTFLPHEDTVGADYRDRYYPTLLQCDNLVDTWTDDMEWGPDVTRAVQGLIRALRLQASLIEDEFPTTAFRMVDYGEHLQYLWF